MITWRTCLWYLLLAATAECGVVYRVKLTANQGGRTVELDSEQYTAGVVQAEAGELRSSEALKAMAVAARTYAANTRSRHKNDGYDFCSTTHCQRFDPAQTTARVQAAVRATAGQLLWYQGKPAFTPYSRDCGGFVERASDIWPEHQEAYLRSKPDPYCVRGGSRRWTWTVTAADIVRALHGANLRCPESLRSVTVRERSTSGRVRTIQLASGGGGEGIAASSFRFAVGRTLGWATLRSDRYEVHSGDSNFYFAGTGEGHGVGLCQRGADEMAAEGHTYAEILRFYFPETELSALGTGIRWQRESGERAALFTTDPQNDAGVLRIAEQCIGALEARLGFHMDRGIEVYLYPDLDSYRNATAEPGWVAAHTRGVRIHLQPRALLNRHRALRSTICHESAHMFVEQMAKASTPLWFREGLVLWLTKSSIPDSTRTQAPNDAALREQTNPTIARSGYQAAARRVSELVDRYGERTVSAWLVSGIPREVTQSKPSNAPTNSR